MPVPGWYRDPERTAPVRWWDGQRWTAWQADTPDAPFPPPGPVETVAARETGLRRRVLVGGLLAAAGFGGLTAYGMGLDERRRAEARAAAMPSVLGSVAPAPQQELAMVVDEATGFVRWSRLLTVQLPPPPFQQPAVLSSGAVVSTGVLRNAVDAGWTAADAWWPPTAVIGVPRDEYLDPTDLPRSAVALAGALRQRLYATGDDQPDVTVSDETRFTCPAARATAEARFVDGRGAARTSRVRVTVLAVRPVAHAMWLDTLPDGSSQASADALDRAYDTIWVA